MEKKRILLFFDLYNLSYLWFFYSKRKKIILVIDCIFFFYLTMSFLRARMLQSITKHSTWERRRLSFGDTGFNFGVELTWMKLLLHNFTKIVTNLYFPYSVSWHDKDVNWYSYCIWKVPYYFFWVSQREIPIFCRECNILLQSALYWKRLRVLFSKIYIARHLLMLSLEEVVMVVSLIFFKLIWYRV